MNDLDKKRLDTLIAIALSDAPFTRESIIENTFMGVPTWTLLKVRALIIEEISRATKVISLLK